MKTKSAAILTIYRISDMSPNGRREIIKWLLTQIATIEKYHHVNGGKAGFPKRYTARYLYR